MVSKAQKFRLGIFIVVTSLLLISFLMLIAGKKIMEKRDNYCQTFKQDFEEDFVKTDSVGYTEQDFFTQKTYAHSLLMRKDLL